MTCGVYEIVNKETNQSYIGRSINIENRWIAHKTSPTNNMAPTIELYEKNPEMVEFRIILEIDENAFEREELKFITSVCELNELNKRGGWDSDNLINGRDGNITPCPPSILSKRELLPSCIDIEDIVYGIEQWYHDWHYKANYNPRSDLYWYRRAKELTEKIEELEKKNTNPLSYFEQQKIHSAECRAKMEVEYEHYKLKKDNAFLQDEIDELKSNIDFWKNRCKEWRKKFFDLEMELEV